MKQDGLILCSSCTQQNEFLYHQRCYDTFSDIALLPSLLITHLSASSSRRFDSTTITGSSLTYHSNSLILLVIRLKPWSLILSTESCLFKSPLLSVLLESEILGVPLI
jgi:hypothetical protein